MNQKKKQEKTKFSRLRLRSAASTSKKSVSPFVNPREKISSYFSSQLDETENDSKSQELFTSGTESQYGQKLSSNEKLEIDDDNDFDEKKSQKPSKVFEIKVQKESKLTRKRTRNKNDLSRFVKDMGPSCSDTNQEHLHLALAMSKSLQETENPGQSQEDCESYFPSTQQKIATIKSTLDQFGFKSDKSPIEIPTLRNNTRQRKKLKFITPTLFLRTEEDRTKLIETKVSGILTNISVYNKFLEENETKNNNKEDMFVNNKPNSFLLRDYYDEESTIFKINNLSLSEINDTTFYNKTVPKEVIKPGVLLKNWHTIPGREKTPPLSEENIIVEETEKTQEIKEKSTNKKNNRLLSEIDIEETEKSDDKEKMFDKKNSYPSSEENVIVEETEITPKSYKDQRKTSFSKENNKSTFYKTVPEEVLLKNLHSIPGREKTPLLSVESIIIDKTEKTQEKEETGTSKKYSSLFSEKTEKNDNKEKMAGKKNSCPSFEENMIVEETPANYEDQRKTLNMTEINKIRHANSEETSPKKITKNLLFPNTPSDRSISPDLFSDCESELGINKSPNHLEKSACNSFNFHLSPNSSNKNKETSPIIVLSSSNSKIENSPVLSEKEIFSDDSDSKSLSLLDSISPRRNKNVSPKKKLRNSNLPRKALFIGYETDSDELNQTKNTEKDIFPETNSPVKTFEDYTQICHYESFHDNSNDCFGLSRSSEDSNKQLENVSISENLFSETVNEIGGHDENFSAVIEKQKEILQTKETEEFIDLTQSSNDAEKIITKKNIEDSNDRNNFEQKYKKHFEETILFSKNKTVAKFNDEASNKKSISFEENNDANDSIQNLFFKKNISSKNINDNEEIDTVLLKSELNDADSNDSIKTVLLMKNNSIEKINDTEKNKTLNNIKSLEKNNSNNDQDKILDVKKNVDDDYSPEFDILNSSNNKDFYNSLSKTSLSVISDSESDNEQKSLRDWSKTFNNISSKSQTSNIIPKKKSLSPNINKSPIKSDTSRRENKTLKRSFSENIINDKELNFVSQVGDKTDFFKLSSPLSVTNFFTQPCLINNHELLPKNQINENVDFDQSLEVIGISDEELNYSVFRSKKTKIKKTNNRNINDISDSDEELNKSDEKPKVKAIVDKNNKLDDDDGQCLSQSSIDTCSDISDEELNYSTNKSFRIKRYSEEIDDIQENMRDVDNFIDFNDLPYTGFEPTRTSLNINETLNKSKPLEILKHPRVQDLQTPTKVRSESGFAPNEVLNQTSTPNNNENNVKTPENTNNISINITPDNDYIIKTKDVTPMPNYNEMNSPQLKKELDKFGIRPLKRAKGIKILQYIYEATHPILKQNLEKTLKSSTDEEDDRIIKRRKKNTSVRSSVQKQLSKQYENTTVECIGNEIANCEKDEDMIFERKQSVRIASCRLPLHIAWYNLVSSNQELYEKILLYEPIQVEEIYAKFKSFGFKFHIQDIIAFLDKKCITIRVAQNQKKTTGS